MLFEIFALLFGASVGFFSLFITLVNVNKESVGLSEITLGIFSTVMFMSLSVGSFVIEYQGATYMIFWLPMLLGGFGIISSIFTVLLIFEFVKGLMKREAS